MHFLGCIPCQVSPESREVINKDSFMDSSTSHVLLWNVMKRNLSPSSVDHLDLSPACLLACLPICLLAFTPACLPACPPACLCTYLPACFSPACLLLFLPGCLPASPPACPPAYLPARLPGCLPACLAACPPAWLPACFSSYLTYLLSANRGSFRERWTRQRRRGWRWGGRSRL